MMSNACRLISPKTIYGAIDFMSDIKFVKVNKLISQWFMLLLTLVVTMIYSNHQTNTNPLCIRALACLSPFSIGLLVESTPIAIAMVNIANEWRVQRFEVFQVAKDVLAARFESGRAQQRNRYDLYLPKPSSSSRKAATPGLIFLPGYLVDHTSYAPLAAQLSDKGIIVAVMSMEPLRIASANMGADASDVLAVMKDVSNHLGVPVNWSIGGHSLGAYAAMRLVKSVDAKKLVLLAAGTLDNLVPDLSDKSNVHVLLIQASQDKMAKFQNRQEEERFKSKMPSSQGKKGRRKNRNLKIYSVKGGNHAGFAAYPTIPAFDGKRNISWQKQQQIVCDLTAKFLLLDG